MPGLHLDGWPPRPSDDASDHARLSWNLLAAEEQEALAQLSVFDGGFTLEAAEAVLELSALWPEDAVQALVGKSLVRRLSDVRLDMLVSVQEYAAEKLDGSGGHAEVEARHGTCCGELEEWEKTWDARRNRIEAWLEKSVVDVSPLERSVGRLPPGLVAAPLRCRWLCRWRSAVVPDSRRGYPPIKDDSASETLEGVDRVDQRLGHALPEVRIGDVDPQDSGPSWRLPRASGR